MIIIIIIIIPGLRPRDTIGPFPGVVVLILPSGRQHHHHHHHHHHPSSSSSSSIIALTPVVASGGKTPVSRVTAGRPPFKFELSRAATGRNACRAPLVGEMAVWRAGKGSWASGRGVLQEAPMGEGEGGHDDDEEEEEEDDDEEEDEEDEGKNDDVLDDVYGDDHVGACGGDGGVAGR
jgi:hypothetical protein